MRLIKGLAAGFMAGYFGYLTVKTFRDHMAGDRNLKFVMVFNSDKNLPTSDLADYFSKAALECYIKSTKTCYRPHSVWESSIRPKMILKTKENGNEILLDLQKQAEKMSLISVLIKEDLGNDYVIIGIGPGDADMMDEVVLKFLSDHRIFNLDYCIC